MGFKILKFSGFDTSKKFSIQALRNFTWLKKLFLLLSTTLAEGCKGRLCRFLGFLYRKLENVESHIQFNLLIPDARIGPVFDFQQAIINLQVTKYVFLWKTFYFQACFRYSTQSSLYRCPTENFNSIVFYCFNWRMTKISTD